MNWPPIAPMVMFPRGSGLDDMVRLLAGELARPRVATTVVLDRLVDILLVPVLWV